MLTYGQPVETTAQKCNKGLSVLEAKATKGTEQRYLLLLYVTVVFSITDYGPGLTKNGTDKSAKAGQSAERGNDSHVGNHQWHTHWDNKFMLDLQPMQIRPRLSGASQSILQCRGKFPQLTPRSRERHKKMQTGTGQVLGGSNRRLNIAVMPAERYPTRFRHLYIHVRKLGKEIKLLIRTADCKLS